MVAIPPLVKAAFYKVGLPLFFITAGCIRPSVISAVYVLLGLIALRLPTIKARSHVQGSIVLLLITATAFSAVATIAQIGWQVYVAQMDITDAGYRKACQRNLFIRLMRLAGFEKMADPVPDKVGSDRYHVVLPEALALFASALSTIITLATKHTPAERRVEDDENGVRPVRDPVRESGGGSFRNVARRIHDSSDRFNAGVRARTATFSNAMGDTLRRASNLAIIIFVGVVGCIQPSILSAFYFFFFLFVLTWYSMHKTLRHAVFNRIKQALIAFAGIHFYLIFLYQIPFLREFITDGAKGRPWLQNAPRLLGLAEIVVGSCDAWWQFEVNDRDEWPVLINPLAILSLYVALIWQLSFTKQGTQRFSRVPDDDTGSSVHEELLVDDSGDDGQTPPEVMRMRKITSQVMDRQRISQILRRPRAKESAASRGVIVLFTFFFTQAYVIGLIAMMAWAMIYHSIFGLVLLLLACVIWIFPDSRRAAFVAAPIIVLYVEALLVIQYIYSMDVAGLLDSYPDIGMIVGKDAIARMTTIIAKLLLSLPIFLILRLARRDKAFEALNEQEKARKLANYGTFSQRAHQQSVESDGSDVADKPSAHAIFDWAYRVLVCLWIFGVFAVLLGVATSGRATLFGVGFLAFFAVLVLLFKFSFACFRQLTFVAFTLLIAYVSAVIVSVYVYQFPTIPDLWRNWTHLDDEWNNDIGLIVYRRDEDGSLVLHLLLQIALFVVTMLQLKVFHNKWKQLTNCMRGEAIQDGADNEEPVASGSRADAGKDKKKFNDRLGHVLSTIVDVAWRITEVHVSKAVFLIVLWFIVTKVAAMHVPLIILLCLAVCLPSTLAGLFSILMCGYLCALAIAQAVFQMHVFRSDSIDVLYGNFSECNFTTPQANRTFIEWVGFEKNDHIGSLLQDIILAIVALAVQSVVVYRRAYQRAERGELEGASTFVAGRRRVFPDASPKEMDRSMGNLFKWLVDYAFYKFGVELCLILMAIDAWVRMDVLGAIVVAFLVILSLSPRSVVRAIWPILTGYLAIVIPLQYALFVGLPPRQCIEYPWSSDEGWMRHLGIWLNLANYDQKWDGGYVFADFLLLMAVAGQLFVFKEEPSSPDKSDGHLAGDNFTIYHDSDYTIKPNNPHHDFITKQNSFVDFFKIAIFQYGHWVTLLMVLVAGLGGTSLFALGYICLSFYLLWEGNNLYLMKKNKNNNSHKMTITRWYGLLGYTVVVMFFKVSLQVVGCVFLDKVPCAIRQLFSVTCVCVNVLNSDPTAFVPDTNCMVEANETRIGFDTLAFAFLVFQLRVLNSWYFQHCIVEFRSEIVLANRGAVLKNQLIEKEMKEQNEQQHKKFDEIKLRTAAIRARYDELQKEGTHFSEPETYGQAKRAGDYYMFDYDPSKDELGKHVESFVPEVDPESAEFKKLDPTQLAYAAIGKDLDLKSTVESAEAAEKIADPEGRMIEAVKSAPGRLDTEPELESNEEGKLVWLGRFVAKFVTAGLDWFSAFLNQRSREHRYVAFVLSKEKQLMKTTQHAVLTDVSRPLTDIVVETKSERALKVVHSESDIDKMETEAINSWQRRSVMARLTNAIGYCIAAHTDIVCYMLAVIAHARCAGLITLPLPVMVFLWGTLSNPRPSKFFWVTMIAYTEFCVVVKFIMQFGFVWDTKEAILHQRDPYWYPKILGVQKAGYATFWETALLMALFFHRYMLRKLGLWKDANVSDTFLASDLNPEEIEDLDEEGEGQKRSSSQKSTATKTTTVGSPVSAKKSEIEGTAAESTTQPTTSSAKTTSPSSKTSPSEGHSSRKTKSGEGEDDDEIVTDFTQRETAGQETSEKAKKNGDEPAADGSQKGADEPDSMKQKSESKGGIFRFIYQLFSPKFRYIRDLYPAMFALDIICLLIITFGYSSFGDGGSGSVVSDIQSNRIPFAFVVMLIISSFMIVIDRGLYLRKAVYAKLAYQFVIIILMHVWIFFVLPSMTGSDAAANFMAQFLYVVKGIYLLISAWQIRNGYPSLCIGNLLMHSYGLLNMIFFKIFMAVPFLFELRTTIDWTWTDTSMPLFDFFNMENFYATIYNLKCARSFEQEYPAPRGEKKGMLVKYMMGLPIVIFIVLLIWCPLLAFSLLNRIGKVVTPEMATLSVAIEGYPPLYTIQAQGAELSNFNEGELRNLSRATSNMLSPFDNGRTRTAVAFVQEYQAEDILKVKFRPESQSYWEISTEALTALKKQLDDPAIAMRFNIHLEFIRPRVDETKEPVKHSRGFSLAMDGDMRKRLQAAIGGNETANVLLPLTMPPFVIVPNEGEVKDAALLLKAALNSSEQTLNETYAAINLRLNGQTAGAYLWTAQLRYNNTSNVKQMLLPDEKTPYGAKTLEYLQVVAFVDRVFPTFLSKLVQGGIIAMYIAVVIFVGRFLRGIFTTAPQAVQITEIPNPDYLLKICLDIYLVREAKDFILEQDLFAKLIFLFRSPATLIKWTRNRPKTKRD